MTYKSTTKLTLFSIALAIFFSLGAVTQAEGDWTNDMSVDLGFSQVALDNWSAGGEESWAWNMDFRGSFKRELGKGLWKNGLKVAYGMSKTGDNDAQKSIDELRFNSTYTFSQTGASGYVSLLMITQLAEGKDTSVTPEKTVSYFFDPAYITESVGMEWTLSESLETRAGVALKQIVADKTSLTSSKSDVGGEWVTQYKDTVWDWLEMETLLQVFSDFKALDETDVYWDATFKAKLVEHINWKLNLNFVYDKDVSASRQIKQSLSLGLHFDLI